MEAVMSKRRRGTGNLTPAGYIRYSGVGERFEHRRVWCKSNGDVPDGMMVHHLDGNRQNNVLENLMLVDALTHKRLHGECEMRNGEWWKPCTRCKEYKMVNTDFYRKQKRITSWCKDCCKQYEKDRRIA